MTILLKSLCALGLLNIAAPARAATMPPALADLAARLLPSVVSVASTEPVTGNADANGNNAPNDDNGGPNGDGGGDGSGGNDDGGGDDGSAFHPQHAADTDDAAGSVLPPPKAEEALGSGFVIDPSGYILTNNHVIDGATSVTVTFQDGTILPATIAGRDKDGDLAVLKVDAGHRLVAVQFGDSGKLRVGDWVLAIGNPFGLPGSTSAGIVSALDRNINEDKYDDFIQTDATINRGNSGGPLFDMAGHVIGINSAIYSPSGGSAGIGFAIPAAMARPVALALERYGSIQRGWLGVSTQEVTPDVARAFNLPGTDGALIGGVSPGGPADGRLQSGDDLVSLAGVPIADPRGLMIRTAEIPAGQNAPVAFWRNGRLQQASLTVAAPPAQLDDTQASPPAAAPGTVAIPAIGMTVAAMPNDTGLPVVAVSPNGPAAKAGMVADDVVEQLAGAMVNSAKDLQGQLKTLGQPVAVLLVTGDIADGSDPGPRWVPVKVKVK